MKLEDKPFELEIGTRYVTRSGRLSGEVRPNPTEVRCAFLADIDGTTWSFFKNGFWHIDKKERPIDLIRKAVEGVDYRVNPKMKLERNKKYVDMSGDVWGEWDGMLMFCLSDEGIQYLPFNEDGICPNYREHNISHEYVGTRAKPKTLADTLKPANKQVRDAVGKFCKMVQPKEKNSGGLANNPTKEYILDAAKQAVADRGLNYGKPEDNFKRIAALWSAHVGKDITESDVAIMMVLMKCARLQNSPHHTDSWVDVAGYAACGGALKEKSGE